MIYRNRNNKSCTKVDLKVRRCLSATAAPFLIAIRCDLINLHANILIISHRTGFSSNYEISFHLFLKSFHLQKKKNNTLIQCTISLLAYIHLYGLLVQVILPSSPFSSSTIHHFPNNIKRKNN